MGGISSVHLTSTDENHSGRGHIVQVVIDDQLTSSIQNNSAVATSSHSDGLVQPEIHNESLEQKVLRLEQTLLQERKEKWAAIETSERRRVELINCQKLIKSREDEHFCTCQTNARGVGPPARENGPSTSEHSNLRTDIVENGESRADSNQSMNKFRIQLQEHRVARQKAIAAKSAELDQLRAALKHERLVREKLERNLAQAATGNMPEQCSDLFTENVSILENENCELRGRIKALEHCVREKETALVQQKNDLKHALRKHDRLVRDSADLETRLNRTLTKLKDSEEDQVRLCELHNCEKSDFVRKTVAMKNIIEISRQMLAVRESQVGELRQKIEGIEDALDGNKKMRYFKEEYEKQLSNIKLLKELYEDRMKLMEDERTKLLAKASEDSTTIEDLQESVRQLTNKNEIITELLNSEKLAKEELQRESDALSAQAYDYKRELSVMNGLLTKMLTGPRTTDLDRLTELLQQHHSLLTDMRDCEDYSLPRLLLDLAVQSCPDKDSENNAEGVEVELPVVSYMDATTFRAPRPPSEPPSSEETPSAARDELEPAVQEIVTNLPKVWKVLSELLSQQAVPEETGSSQERNCYKSVDTPQGPKNVISVSNTFLRLKDLILEKNSLQRELVHLKHLNTHLETRLDDQEKRLSKVQKELHKTWGIVGRMRAQHQQLHNQETILRYELQEKRVMLSELRQELEECRDKWDSARRKNEKSEDEWRALRRERRSRLPLCGHQDSAESGYSDSADRSGTSSPINGPGQPSRPEIDEETAKDVSGSQDASERIPSDLSEERQSQLEAEDSHATALREVEALEICSTDSLGVGFAPQTVAPDDQAELSASVNSNILTQPGILDNSEETPSLDLSMCFVTETSVQESENLLDDTVTSDIGECTLNNVFSSAADTDVPQPQTEYFDVEPQDEITDNREEISLASEIDDSLFDNSSQDTSNRLSTDVAIMETPSRFDLHRDTTLAEIDALPDDSSTVDMSASIECNVASEEAESGESHNELMLSVLNEIVDRFPSSLVDGITPSFVENGDQTATEESQADYFMIPSQDGDVNEVHAVAADSPNSQSSHINAENTSQSDVIVSGSCQPENLPCISFSSIDTDSIKSVDKPEPSKEETTPAALSYEERMAAREERLRRLEDQCKKLVGKVSNTVRRGNSLATKLDEMHEEYSGHENANDETVDTGAVAPPTSSQIAGNETVSSSDNEQEEKDAGLETIRQDSNSN